MPAIVGRYILLTAGSLFAVSCATITTGRYEEVRVTSSPTEATAMLVCGGRPAGEAPTPAVFKIRRNAGDCNLTLRKDGFEEKSIFVEQGVNPAYWGNMIFTPLPPGGAYVATLTHSSNERAIGIGIFAFGAAMIGTDFWTGAVHEHKPHNIDATLKPK